MSVVQNPTPEECQRIIGEIKKKRPPIVCICGSTRFAELMNAEAQRLTLAGEIVVRPEVVAYSKENDQQFVAPEVKAMLDELHLRKIDLADYVYVVNQGGYIGESTRREIEYAWSIRKFVYYHQAPGEYKHKIDKTMPVGGKVPHSYIDPDITKRD